MAKRNYFILMVDITKGQFQNVLRNGDGTFFYNNGASYFGPWEMINNMGKVLDNRKAGRMKVRILIYNILLTYAIHSRHWEFWRAIISIILIMGSQIMPLINQRKAFQYRYKCSFLKKNENSQFPISTTIDDFNIAIHRKNYRSNKEPSYFFRRLPSLQSLNSNSIFNKLTLIKSKSTQDKLQNGKIMSPPKIEINKFIPQNTKTQISWINLISSLHGPQYPLKKWIKQLVINNRIFDENDFAIQSEFQSKHIKQTTLVSLVAEIIEEFEK